MWEASLEKSMISPIIPKEINCLWNVNNCLSDSPKPVSLASTLDPQSTHSTSGTQEGIQSIFGEQKHECTMLETRACHQMGSGALRECCKETLLYTFFSLWITEMKWHDIQNSALMFWRKRGHKEGVWPPVWESLYSVIHEDMTIMWSCVDWANESDTWSTKRYVQWLWEDWSLWEHREGGLNPVDTAWQRRLPAEKGQERAFKGRMPTGTFRREGHWALSFSTDDPGCT